MSVFFRLSVISDPVKEGVEWREMSAEIANLGRRIFIATHYDNVVNFRAPTAIILTLAAQAMLAYHRDNIFSGACVSIAAVYED